MADGPITKATALLKTRRSGALALIAAVAGLALVSGSIRTPGLPEVSGAAQAQDAKSGKAPSQTQFSADQVTALRSIIRDYLMEHPEILADVSRELEKKQAAEQAARAEQFLSQNKAEVFAASTDFVLGNPKGDITVVEFFDYNCGWCKRAITDLVALTKSDPKVRVVMKEYPIFGGPASVTAAKAAMASVRQNKYWEYHAAMMKEKQVTEQTVFSVAERVGLNVARLKADMNDAKIAQAIDKNIQLGQSLGIEGTPGFLVDSRVNVGYVPASGLTQMIAEIRKQGCKIC